MREKCILHAGNIISACCINVFYRIASTPPEAASRHRLHGTACGRTARPGGRGHGLTAGQRPAAGRPGGRQARPAGERIVPRNQEPGRGWRWQIMHRNQDAAGPALARCLVLPLPMSLPPPCRLCSVCSCSARAPASCSALSVLAPDLPVIEPPRGPRAPAGRLGQGRIEGRHGPPTAWAKAPMILGHTLRIPAGVSRANAGAGLSRLRRFSDL